MGSHRIHCAQDWLCPPAAAWLDTRGLIPKHERRFTGFDDKIIAMYARGMTVREIRTFLAEQYGTDVGAARNP